MAQFLLLFGGFLFAVGGDGGVLVHLFCFVVLWIGQVFQKGKIWLNEVIVKLKIGTCQCSNLADGLVLPLRQNERFLGVRDGRIKDSFLREREVVHYKESLQSSFDEGHSSVLCPIASFAFCHSLSSQEQFRAAELS